MNDERDFIPIWKVRAPTRRASMPEWMSFHYLREAESCPRACALRHAHYDQLWNRSRYPSKPAVTAVTGIIVHTAAALIIKEMMNDGVASAKEAKAMGTLRRLGGYSAILSGILEGMLKEEADNPRFQQFAAPFARLLLSKIPRMRESLQELLRDQSWTLRASNGSSMNSGVTSSGETIRRPLKDGTYFEVELRDVGIKWKGRLDIITISDKNCAISDLKTGSPSEEHVEQLLVYSVLWNGDRERNPNCLPIERMNLCYGGNSIAVIVPPDARVSELRKELHERTVKVTSELGQDPVIAMPSSETCRFCQVKLLCNDYWYSSACGQIEQYRDLVLKLISPHGDSLWSVQVVSPTGSSQEEVVFKRSQNETPFWQSLEPGMQVRLTDVLYTVREDDKPLVTLTMFSEGLLLDK